ncbi:hypothetical protein GCM10010104_46590 [Streptomyces indiaensis]|uniref:Uncharacterized protein n=1 Tax=Streptomyces indiaensis TaxID=284033 RepID=A0ABP5QV23_9ACTN
MRTGTEGPPPGDVGDQGPCALRLPGEDRCLSGETFCTDGRTAWVRRTGADAPRYAAPTPAAGCVVTGIDGAPVGAAGRGLVAAADEETHGLLMSMTVSMSR